jgi:hypothetical protein
MKPAAAFEEVKKLGLVIEEIPRTVVDRVVWVLGEKFEVDDLYETLMELKRSSSSTTITSPKMERMLKSVGIIDGTSRSWGTSIVSQKRLEEFIDLVRGAYDVKKEKAA